MASSNKIMLIRKSKNYREEKSTDNHNETKSKLVTCFLKNVNTKIYFWLMIQGLEHIIIYYIQYSF